MQNADRFDDKEKRFSGLMVAGMVMMAAAMLLTGPLSIAAGVIGGTLFGLAADTFFHSDESDDRISPVAWPQRERIEPQQAICLEADAPPSARLWLERVGQNAASLRRNEAGAPAIDSWAETVQKYASVTGDADVNANNRKLSR